MRVLILANNDIGLYKFRKELLEELVKENKVYICLPDGEFIPKLKKTGCKFIDCKYLVRRGTNPLTDLKLMVFYKQLIHKTKPDIVFTYTIKPNIYGGMACAKLGVPYVANVTGLGTAIENGGLLQKITLSLYKYGLRKAQKVFFQNEANRNHMIKHHVTDRSSGLLPGSGVNLQENQYEDYPDEKNGIHFLFVGRIMKDKGVDELLVAAERIKRKHPNVSFSLVGGYEEESYRKKIETFERHGIVKAYGEQKDVHSFMKSHHAVIQPSYHEGLSNVLLEAAASGRPVLASDIPGCRETFSESISGIGFVRQDADSLREAIEKFLSLSEEERNRMGRMGREKVEKEFSRDIVVQAYLSEAKKA